MSSCKFCGSKLRQSRDDGAKFFACGTGTYSGGQSFRTSDCRAEELARYRDMFPIPPWDESPITSEVCERLGIAWIHCTVDGHALLDFWCEWGNHKERVDVRYGAAQSFSSIKTAGQLACLVAARRAAT